MPVEPVIIQSASTGRQIYRVRGMSSRQYPDENLSPENASVMTNMERTDTGTVRKRKGQTLYNTNQITGAKDVTGLYQATFVNGTTFGIETAGTAVYTNDGTTRTAVTGTLTLTDSANARHRFAFMKDTVVATNGTDETWAKTVSGNAAALSGVLWTTCNDLVVHRNILVCIAPTVGGTKEHTRLYWCDVNPNTGAVDVTIWPTDNIYHVFQGGAEALGGFDAFDRLFVIKKDGAYPVRLVDDGGYIEATLIKDEIQRGIEFIAPHTIISRPEFGWAVARDGMYRIQPGANGIEYTNVVKPRMENEWETTLNKARLQYAVSSFRSKDTQVRTLLSSSSHTTDGHDQIWVYDWTTGEIWIEKPSTALNYTASIVISSTEYDYIGTVDGYALRGNLGTVDNATAFTWKVDMAPNDLGLPGVDKHIINVHTIYIPQGAGSVKMTVERDQGRLQAVSDTRDLGTSLQWDNDEDWDAGLIWPGGSTREDVFFVNKTCKTLSPTWEATDDVEIIGYYATFEILE